jgi:NADH dehydrogenase FAD-containing subunit
MHLIYREVKEKTIEFANGDSINYGVCLWAAGNGPLPFVKNLIEKVSAIFIFVDRITFSPYFRLIAKHQKHVAV